MTRPRKSKEYEPLIPALVRDAWPRWQYIEGEPDPKKRRENERRRDVAIDALGKLWADPIKRAQLDPSARLRCQMIVDANGGQFPKSKGGRPADEHRRPLIHVAVIEKLESATPNHGAVARALNAVAEEEGCSYALVRNIFYDRDPEWVKTVRAELARRRYEKNVNLKWEKIQPYLRLSAK